MWESSVADGLLTLHGLDTSPSSMDLAAAATFQTCAAVSDSPPFDCGGYLDAFCRMAMNENIVSWDDRCSSLNTDELIDMLCDEHILERCGQEQVPYCTWDVSLNTYADHVEMFRELYSSCRNGDLCQAAHTDCMANLPAISRQLDACIASPNASVAQAHNASQYYPSDLYLCSLARDWTYGTQEGATNTSCDVILVDVRQLEKNFNAQVGAQNRRDLAFCRESAQQASCTNGSTLTYSFNDRLLVLPTTDQSSGCHTHADCPYDHFCGMMVTGSACQTNSLCMPCFWCEGCHPNTSASPAYWYLTPVEPTCGHCPCAEECSPGCSVSMLENDHCDAACFTRTCDYDNHQCPYPSPEETSEELAPALQPCDADATQVVRTANTGAARYNVEASLAQGCCAPFTQSSATDESETRTLQVVVSHFAGFDDFPGIEQVPFGWQNKVSQDSFEYWRLLNNRNRVLGGVVMKTFRHDFTACGDGVFRKFVGSCHEATSSTELSSAYSADGVFQIGNPFYDPVIAKDQHVHYPDPADLNKYGVPYGFRAHQMKDGTVAYPVVLDCNLDSERAFELVDFLQACDYFDTRSTSFTLQLLTYKGMRTRWHVNTRDMLLMYMQLILVIFVCKQLCSELMEMWQAWRTHGSVMDGIEVFNWAFLFFFVIAHTIYLQLLISMDRFDMSVRYHIYESLSGHDGSGHHVNWLQLHNDGEDLSEFEQKLQEFSELLALKSEYQLFTALTIIAALIKVLKLMDFHPDIGMVTRTVRQGGTDLLNFVGLLITIVVMYAMMGHIIFGGTMASFSKFTFSLRTCFVMMMGDTDFNDRLYALDEGYETVGTIFFVTFMILVFVFLLSAFLGIIVSAMEEVKAQNAGEKKNNLFSDIARLTAFYAKSAACATQRFLDRYGLRHSRGSSAISESLLYEQLQSWQAHMAGSQGRHRVAPRSWISLERQTASITAQLDLSGKANGFLAE
ncbi:hypothetical protein CYMTET_21575 [Cymbomonas tetramitiformis]|uniref:Polycystin cation channel PKD1/PKD2 domain-containing protein n=1 Tax=Cymbomonas tetramitiformis TaxID=36881 RepID=A0AAE0L353_9CHLO|nr:hypothetical protein CYMTET_21575 [Cymbomonas tetramitiformis]